ncbi:hypothetical protein ACM3N8_04560 [Aeromonas sp. A04]|uniref:hypothetical protein n=1 Tax=Aeromonas sp. A04 TaxID=3398359 RepID=UPI0039F705A9
MLIEKIYGVSKDIVGSYIERPLVDERFSSALRQTKQIIIYGSSKQGKTALVQKHVPEKNRITVHCGPNSTMEDLYRSILRQAGVEIVTGSAVETSRELEASISAKFTAMIPFFGKGEANAEGSATAGHANNIEYKKIEFNLGLAQDIAELLKETSAHNKFFVVENFHYLSPEVQSHFAFDLRTFEELGLRFIILGVWREANRLIQFNGDLQDRISEIPVEPWSTADFEQIVLKGQPLANVVFSEQIKNTLYQQAHGSVAVVQELLKKICEFAGVLETHQGASPLLIEDQSFVRQAIDEKVREYSARHVRSLESIAAGSRTRRPTEDTAALYLPYYVVAVLVARNYEQLREGIERKELQELIKAIHPNEENVRTSDVTGMLLRLSALQASANIIPPLFDYDRGNRRIKVVDSTLFFFIDNSDPEDVMSEIPHPDPTSRQH